MHMSTKEMCQHVQVKHAHVKKGSEGCVDVAANFEIIQTEVYVIGIKIVIQIYSMKLICFFQSCDGIGTSKAFWWADDRTKDLFKLTMMKMGIEGLTYKI